MKHILILIFSIAGVISTAFSQEKVLYKTIDSTQLYLEVYQPTNMSDEVDYPAMIFFFGGGWNGGSTSQFKPHALHYSHKGIICFLAEYRVKSRNNTSPFESLKDAKSAIRYLKEHAKELNIDPNKIIASGGSAGGHLAAATAFIEGFNESTDNLNVSPKPNTLVLFNPVVDNGPGGYGFERIGEFYKDFSPLHNIQKGAPPTIFFLGTNDSLIPVETAEYYKMVMQKVGSNCELHLYPNEKHGFFNYRNKELYDDTIEKTDAFLSNLGYF